MTSILVTGGNGQLASCIKDVEKQHDDLDVIYTDYLELDICDLNQVQAFFKTNKQIDYCINCAAYTAVDKAEKEEEKAFHINATGAKNLALVCNEFGVVLIHISTDFVFDGKKIEPYTETDLTNPISVYGASKLQGEVEIQQILKEHFIIRTSWLYSEHGNNFMKTMLRLAETKEEISVVSDQVGTPTYAGDLANVVLHIINTKSQSYGMYHYSNEGKVSWSEFAEAIFNFSETAIKVNPIPTSNYPTPAKRPTYSVLGKNKIKEALHLEILCWKDSLKKAITRLKMIENLQIAIEASLRAGEEILKIYSKDFSIEYKDDKSPLTEADLVSNKIIMEHLQPTNIPVISEENKQLPFSTRQKWEQCWIVDPIDGTKEFIKKNGEFTVNIALVGSGITKLGIIYVPVSRELYYTNENKTKAYKTVVSNINEPLIDLLFQEKDLIKPASLQDSKIKVVGSRSHMNQETLDFVESLKREDKQVDIVSKGSSLKFCLVAEGKADVYPRFAPTMEWDTAAGQAICEAVGLRVIDQKTKELMQYNRENLLNNYFLVTQ